MAEEIKKQNNTTDYKREDNTMTTIKLTGVKNAVKEFNDWTHGGAEIWINCDTGEVHTSLFVGYNSWAVCNDDSICSVARKCRIWDDQKTSVADVKDRCYECMSVYRERGGCNETLYGSYQL